MDTKMGHSLDAGIIKVFVVCFNAEARITTSKKKVRSVCSAQNPEL